MAEKFPTSSSRNFSDNFWSSSVSRARGFIPESVAQFFKSTNPLCTRTVHHSTQSCKTLELRLNRHHYCTAQTHQNIRTERQASDILCSIRRTEICCDSRQLYESNWTLHSSVTCISKRDHYWRMAHHRDGYRARFSPSGFFISSNIHSWQKDPLI